MTVQWFLGAGLKYVLAHIVQGVPHKPQKKPFSYLLFLIITVIHYCCHSGFCHAIAYVATLVALTLFRGYCLDFGWYWSVYWMVCGGGYVSGQTWQLGAAMFGPKHTPVGTCKINCKFTMTGKFLCQVLLQGMFQCKHTRFRTSNRLLEEKQLQYAAWLMLITQEYTCMLASSGPTYS